MRMKYTTLSLLGFTLAATSLVHAVSAVMNNNISDKDGIVSTKPHFEFTAGALFLQPTGSNLDYAVLGFPYPVLSPHWDVGTVTPGYSTGFYLGGRYLSRSAENDVQLNWAHLSTNDADSLHAGSGQFTTPLFQSGPSAGQGANPATQEAFATAQFNYDIINLDAGQTVHYGQRTDLRFFAGLSGGQLKETLNTSFQDYAQTFNINFLRTGQKIKIGLEVAH